MESNPSRSDRALFWRIKYLEKKMTNLATTKVTITKTNGIEKEVTNKEEMERCIIASNEGKFHQTEGTGQLQKGQLLKDIGSMGDGRKVEQILSGTYKCPPGTSQATHNFLEVLKWPPTATLVPPVTFEEFCDGWKRAKE